MNLPWLPNEMIEEILYQLDIYTIISLTSCNKRLLKILNSLWEFMYWHFYGSEDMDTYGTNEEMVKFCYKMDDFPDITKIYSIRVLYDLNHLSLYNYHLHILPKQIGLLINLQILNLSRNDLDILPREIGLLVNLSILNIGNNNLSSLPKEIGQLTNLKELLLNDNLLTRLPKSIGTLTALVILNLDNNQLSKLPKELSCLKNLVQLSVSDNNLTKIPLSLCQMEQLNLYLRGNQINDMPTLLTTCKCKINLH